MSKFNVKAVIFDLDNTVVHSDPVHFLSAKKAAKEYGIKLTKKFFNETTGLSISERLKLLAKKEKIKKLNDELIKEIVKKKRKYFPLFKDKLSLNPGFKELVRKLKKKGIKTCLATTSSKEQVKLMINKFKLEKYFDVILTQEDVKKLKPDPEIYIKALKKLRLRARDVVIIEDSLPGIQAAKKAGCKVIAIKSSESKVRAVKKAADYYVRNFYELINMF